MNSTLLFTVNIVVWALFCAGNAIGQETWQVKTAPLESRVQLPGVFVADSKSELKIQPAQYNGQLVITRIADEGITVTEGDVVAEFSSTELDEAIESARNDATDAGVTVGKAKAELKAAELNLAENISHLKTELEMLQNSVAEAIAAQAIELNKKEREITENQRALDNARTDLQTLTELYNEPHLKTSNSGDILLARETADIANREARLEFLRKQLTYFKQFDKSKEQIRRELKVAQKQAEIRKQQVVLAAAVTQKQSEFDKAKRELKLAETKISELLNDREQLKVVAPRTGVLFYGQTGQELPRGVVISSNMGDIRDQLHVGGRVQTHQILFTVASMEDLSVKISVTDEDIRNLENGLQVKIFPDAFPNEYFAGELTSVAQFATKTSFLDRQRRFKILAKCTHPTTRLRSGMNCRVEVYCKPAEPKLLVPITAIQKVDDRWMCVVVDGNERQPREVTIGETNYQFVQVLSGLSENENVLVNVE